ncbi:MAG: N-acetylmuramidase family protein [Chitinophagaceae bacterium]|jgi:hypothetical protein|nr:N-acetylmuramidase family protein [Chitinophagaceae bacterium]HQW84827.1 N-acetylmuramidase domain-containing protein [Ferruginibacter sp.]
MKIAIDDIKLIAKNFGIEPAMFLAFIEVESGGKGFDDLTGKILIQFEPSWFRKKVAYAPSGAWSVNKVDVQSKEWVAFNDAFKINPNAAMESTSIGLPQIMGFHWKLLGYKSVGEMWDDFKRGEYQQVLALARYIKANPKLYSAIKRKDWHMIAYLYNGSQYKKMAKKWGREPYNISLEKAYKNELHRSF